MEQDLTTAGMYSFVLTGQSIDRSFYDNLNSYAGEQGSDGVVRVAAANMNFGLLLLVKEKDSSCPNRATLTQLHLLCFLIRQP